MQQASVLIVEMVELYVSSWRKCGKTNAPNEITFLKKPQNALFLNFTVDFDASGSHFFVRCCEISLNFAHSL